MKRRSLYLGALLLTGLLLATVVLAATPELTAWVLGGGGGHLVAGELVLDGTIGQPVAGPVTAGGIELCAGYWCGETAGEYVLYLPLITRDT